MQCPYCKGTENIQSHYMSFLGQPKVSFVCNACGGEFTKKFAEEANASGLPLLGCTKNANHQSFGTKGHKCPHPFCSGKLA